LIAFRSDSQQPDKSSSYTMHAVAHPRHHSEVRTLPWSLGFNACRTTWNCDQRYRGIHQPAERQHRMESRSQWENPYASRTCTFRISWWHIFFTRRFSS
jgi:hypothetical protein